MAGTPTNNCQGKINNGKINIYPQLDNGMQFRLNGIKRIKDYVIAAIRERETISKTLSKYIAAFEYFDKPLLVLSAASVGVSIALFATVTAPIGIASTSYECFLMPLKLLKNFS